MIAAAAMRGVLIETSVALLVGYTAFMTRQFTFDPTRRKAELLQYIDTLDLASYAKTRNHVRGHVSYLSPYITRGVLSLPEVRDRVLAHQAAETVEKFLQELAWREYWQKVYFAKGSAIFSDMRYARDDWAHRELVSAVTSATTGIEAIDAQITELQQTGYMHNHARMWTAMLSCNVANAHWYDMSRWLFYHLIDGDLASNMLSWQWICGTNTGKRYVAHQPLINGCSDTDQHGTYLDVPRDEVGRGDVTEVLHAHEPFLYTTPYPSSDDIPDVSHKTILLYHPWSLDPDWRANENGERILVIEPRLFDRFPISERVCDFIVSVAKTQVPNVQVFVGNVETLPGIEAASSVYSKRYPATTHFPGTHDPGEELYPNVQGYYPSFSKFWQAAQKADA